MKMIAVVAFALVACVAAAPPSGPEVQVLRYNSDASPDGAYSYAFELDNGIKNEAVGETKTVPGEDNKPQVILVVRGAYNQLDAEGRPQTITYYADETGYHADGPAVPQVPARR